MLPVAAKPLPSRKARSSLAIGMFVLATACGTHTQSGATPSAPEVLTATVRQEDVPLYKEWIGTLDGLVNSDIKAQVSGYLVEQAYKEGSFVKAGSLLFRIDPRPFQAAVGQAQGQLAQARGQLEEAHAQLEQVEAQVAVATANQGRTQLDVDRYTPLAQQQAITQQDLDNATQNNLAAKAQLQVARAQVATVKAQITAAEASVVSASAALETARINLGFTQLTSPIDGIPGIAQLQVGALVSPASGTITTVSTLDPIKVYFTVSEQEYLDYTRRFPTATLRQADLSLWSLRLVLADGVEYPQAGTVSFADRQVDVKTGAIRLAGQFPNPGNSLRPGQYAKVRVATSVQKGALLVPQRAVSQLQGRSQIAVVSPDNKVDLRAVRLGEAVATDQIVLDGLQAGDRVVVEGLQKIRQGAIVSPKVYQPK